MNPNKFDPKKLAKLNDPERLQYLPPGLIWKNLVLNDPKVLVDIGAGTGVFSVAFAREMKGGKVYACDISDVMLDWMRENLPEDLRSTVVPLKMEETAVPLPDGTADLVFMINLHHELDDPDGTAREAYRLLRKGGKLMIIDWKKEETPMGPPLGIRLEEEVISKQMQEAGISEIVNLRILKYHHFILGTK